MNPKEYYYNRFRPQFAEWIKKSQAHEHPGEGIFIPIQNLRPEYLSHIPKEDYVFFHCALACTILIDQVMYTYFKEDYPKFQQMTLYPKIEYGITNININPWDVLRGVLGLDESKKFIEFFVADLKIFFKKNQFKKATWEAIVIAILKDKDIIKSIEGQFLCDLLKKDEAKKYGKFKLLHFEDDEMIGAIYKAGLEKEGIKVKHLLNTPKKSDDLIELILKEKPNLIIMGIILPKMDGFTATEILKSNQQTKDIPIFGLDNLSQEEDIKKAIKLGMTDYFVTAHYMPSELVNIIKNFLYAQNEYQPKYKKYL